MSIERAAEQCDKRLLTIDVAGSAWFFRRCKYRCVHLCGDDAKAQIRARSFKSALI